MDWNGVFFSYESVRRIKVIFMLEKPFQTRHLKKDIKKLLGDSTSVRSKSWSLFGNQ